MGKRKETRGGKSQSKKKHHPIRLPPPPFPFFPDAPSVAILCPTPEPRVDPCGVSSERADRSLITRHTLEGDKGGKERVQGCKGGRGKTKRGESALMDLKKKRAFSHVCCFVKDGIRTGRAAGGLLGLALGLGGRGLGLALGLGGRLGGLGLGLGCRLRLSLGRHFGYERCVPLISGIPQHERS